MKEVWVKSKALAKKLGLSLKKEDSGERIEIASFSDLKKLEEAERRGAARAFVSCPNWKVIPLENLIALAKKIKIIAEVKNAQEAKLALQTLEKGADGVLLLKASEREAKEVLSFIRSGEALTLEKAVVTGVKKVGLGGRSCVDTTEMMSEGEGMLVGSAASALFLIQAEVSENPHVASRPFRVNCGALSLYALMADGKTKYLSELEAGDEVLIAGRDGRVRKATVARNKIEWRPLLLIEAKAGARKIKTIVQDAETIRIVTPRGSKSVANLKKGDEVLVKLEEETARHFGMKVKERIIEK